MHAFPNKRAWVYACVCAVSLTLDLGSQDCHLTSCPVCRPRGCSFRKPVLGAQHCPPAHLSPARCSFLPSNVNSEVDANGTRHTGWAGTSLRPSDASVISYTGPLAFPYSLSLDFQVIVAGVAHFTEAGHKEVVAPMVGWGVLLDVGELHKLRGRRERHARERCPAVPLTFGLQAPCHSKAMGHIHPRNQASQEPVWSTSQSKSQHQST